MYINICLFTNKQEGKQTHVLLLEVVSHEEVERGAGPGSDLLHPGATVAQQSTTQLRALLRLLVEEEVGKFPDDGPLRAEHVLHDLDTLISAHQVQEHLQCLHDTPTDVYQKVTREKFFFFSNF